MRARAAEEVRAICSSGIADLVLFSHEVGRFCAQREIPLTARGSATSSLVIWALGLADLCPLDYGLDGRMFVHDGRDDLPDLDLEVSSLHEAAVSAFVQQGGFDHSDSERDGEFLRLRTLRVGIHVSLGARQAVRSAGAALGMEPPRVNSVARQVPLLSSPGAIDNVMMHAPELGISDAGAGVEPYNTLVRVAGQLEGLPHRYGAHPSAYTFSFYGPGALAWLPAQWVSDGGPGRKRAFGAARHLAVLAQERTQAGGLAHQTAVAANWQAPAGLLDPEGNGEAASYDVHDSGGPVLALQWDKLSCGTFRKKTREYTSWLMPRWQPWPTEIVEPAASTITPAPGERKPDGELSFSPVPDPPEYPRTTSSLTRREITDGQSRSRCLVQARDTGVQQ